MKKLILILMISIALFGYVKRTSESAFSPDRFRKLQGGVLIAYNIVDQDSLYKYDEIRVRTLEDIEKVPDGVLEQDEIELLQGYNSLETVTYWQPETIRTWLKWRGLALEETEGLTKSELQSLVMSYLENE